MKKSVICLMLATLFPIVAQATVKVGVVLSSTGPAAAIGIQSQNAVDLWPKTLGGEPAEYIVLDDASDVSQSVRNVRKLTSEKKIDLLVGPNLTAAALAILDNLKETQTPMISLVGSSNVVNPPGVGGREWAYQMAQDDSLMAQVVVDDMVKRGYKRVAFIGFADSFGENWWDNFERMAKSKGLQIVERESYQRLDNSVMGQVLKLMAAKPDAILIAASGTPAVLPEKTLKERGYKGQIYQTHGIGTSEFIQVGGKAVEGTLFPTGPGVVAEGLPDSNPVKKVAMDFTKKYEAVHGKYSTTQFAGDAYGAWLVADPAVARVLKQGLKPGTLAFRQALRKEIEATHELIIPNGVMTISAKDHQGFDHRAAVMGIVKDGRFQYKPD